MTSRAPHTFFGLLFCIMALLIGTVDAEGATPLTLPATFTGELRNYFFQRDFHGQSLDREDLALGGILRLTKSLSPRFAGGLSLYTAQGLGLNDNQKDIYSLLAKDTEGRHKSYTVLGEFYLATNLEKTALKAGRQEMATPWLHPHDVRMTPNSFEAVSLTNKSIANLQIQAAHVAAFKRKNATSFIPLSESVGVGEKRALTLAGLTFSRPAGTTLQAWGYHLHDIWNDLYLRADYERRVNEQMTIAADIRYLLRNDTGESLAGPVDTYVFGLTGRVTVANCSFAIGYSRNGRQDIIRRWGHDYFTAMQVLVPDRAEEQAFRFDASYDFAGLGLNWLKGGFSQAFFTTPDQGLNTSPDKRETNFDLTFDLGAMAKGLSLRTRYAMVDEDENIGGEDLDDFRIYLRYRFHLSL